MSSIMLKILQIVSMDKFLLLKNTLNVPVFTSNFAHLSLFFNLKLNKKYANKYVFRIKQNENNFLLNMCINSPLTYARNYASIFL